MLKNNLYNLLLQLTVENRSLWRIKDEYLKDAEGDAEVLAFWQKMTADKEAHINELSTLVKSRM
ncbi:MAG: hypothetical protein A2653_02320 [Candidatus Zambryskibacteria bacterium RIFCSPHIGHO2_01_FULL_43_25]|uniref:Ferritin/DPS protein domain-containing protein n=1 Tax=Candidatus Zambryskibacteria bacterium RIFCSPLOWO2_01_FULL_45_21 TaxID=1802761 RepID=A0A1G2U383_9BACT|nr:MAG: hypothetical protein A2653_02320 [Candidatus Zambryskibacteria bacterium RIFCSPHIGHO2_01_FULL_43_25]OHB01036.1 MAG: hypothetical protein A3E94_02500 [Candidatus Zambryskibacteria bacterium RIFCSPHIGHO2_12_FULL_44_12b]OHB03919.1 MAG: hypothetical protein A3B14_01130 [Candidatus Zambryskibacteria bacterium RIFCSPLOWO2_01_FULL_45_21]